MIILLNSYCFERKIAAFSLNLSHHVKVAALTRDFWEK